ncbi:peptidase E [Kribbella sp. CA-293567]|uniref:Type 1 glutamine amidotransferase-like domain-containing protein n=1 Tax=Kribbella sp. CA-293567 TaxID=3002436 RepID=UPI0022DE6E40|nr:peptidase E [Kribbella sp. CA-293567]WBQ06144.1 peptidase E [Kribbella sp. CA-293567]
MTSSQILAISGILEGDRSRTRDLISYAVSLAGATGPAKLCFLPTAEGDNPYAVQWFEDAFGNDSLVEASVLTLFTAPNVPDVREHLLAQHVLWVGGGSVVNLMAVWRAHGLPEILHEAWQAGVVMAGQSAGSLCWHLGGPTDSFGELSAFSNGLGWLPWSNGVHDDLGDQPRRTAYREMVASGALPAGYATEGGVGLHYIDGAFSEAVSVVPGARAWYVEGGRETAVEARYLEPL